MSDFKKGSRIRFYTKPGTDLKDGVVLAVIPGGDKSRGRAEVELKKADTARTKVISKADLNFPTESYIVRVAGTGRALDRVYWVKRWFSTVAG